MPGINILSVKAEDYDDISRKFEDVQKRMLHSKFYSYETLLKERNIMLGFTSYKTYPRSIYEDESFLIILEGMIYNKLDEEVKNQLINFASITLNIDDNFFNDLKKFLLETDGEFLIVIYNKSDRTLTVFNDALGRLPVYYHHTNGSLFISREIKFIVPFKKSVDFDKTTLMEYMICGFPFGEKTLVDDIFRFLPATFIKFDVKTGDFFKKVILPINFDKKIRNKLVDVHVKDLKDLFINGLEDRIDKLKDKKLLISISGGLDSRASLAALISINKVPVGWTHTFPGDDEVDYAKNVAKAFDISLDVSTTSKKLEGDDYRRIVFLKDGLNPTSMAFILDDYDKLIERYGENILLCTGLYGGEMFRYLTLTKGINSIEKLSKVLTTLDEYIYPPKKVCRMLNLKEEHVISHLKEYLSGYEEKNLYKQYLHFQFDRHHNWAGEGEDRARFFFWTITPFYSIPFFYYSIFSVEEEKKNLLFFRNFLYELDPRTCLVRYYNNKISLNNIWKLRLYSLAEKLVRHPSIRRYAKFIINIKKGLKLSKTTGSDESNNSSIAKRTLLNTFKDSNIAKKYFSIEDTVKIIEEEQDESKIHRLLTLILYMEQIEELRRL